VPTELHDALRLLENGDARRVLAAMNRGLEKECLRITPDGTLSDRPHPNGLGSALTHHSITTDYSEALLEFITPVSTRIEDCLRYLDDIHRFTYTQLGDEMLWAASMPCIVAGDDGIPVAQYGSSNIARMKTVYRYGLGHRYGRRMQAIAGIHYNWSMPAEFWERAWRHDGSPQDLDTYITDRYLGLVRNFRRLCWLPVYLYGASPAVCATFVRGRDDHPLERFDPEGKSLYLPYATALRMGSLGYNSAAQKDLNICYNSLDNYVETLRNAILQPHPAYADIPYGLQGDYQQLNSGLLQIENEFYSPIRPKRVARSGETALNALVRGGIEYIEVRCVDVSPFSPLGIDAAQARFLDTFLIYCLLRESPHCDDTDQAELAGNLESVVSRGRQPGLTLQRGGTEIPMQQWAQELLAGMGAVAERLDDALGGHDYRDSVQLQSNKIADPELTPSARILREMRESQVSFFRLAMGYSEHWARHFRSQPPAADVTASFMAESARSLAAQQALEASDELSFPTYLDRYFAQYRRL